MWASVLVVLAGAGLVAGCGGQRHSLRSEGSHQRVRSAPLGTPAKRVAIASPPVTQHITTVPAPRCQPSPVSLGSPKSAYALLVEAPTIARGRPGATPTVARLAPRNVNGFPTILAAIAVRMDRECQPAWYQVRLPVIPNGTTGWVSARGVRVFRVTSRIVIDLSSRVLRLYRGGELELQTSVGVGAPSTPTPVGRFYVDERYVLASPDGPFGPDALGISAHSPQLENVWVEHAPIAVHGTNEPWTIGQAESHGCVRVPNATMAKLFRLAPAGTPVVVQA
jgi:lipoprotein-anchoring transpeptidase ErfK/SrfK